MAKETVLLFQSLGFHIFLKHVWIKYGEQITLVGSSTLATAMEEQNHFFPVHLTLFKVISIETRNMRGVFIHVILLTHILDLITGNN